MNDVFSLDHLKSLIKSENVDLIKEYMDYHNLKLDKNKIVPKSKEEYEQKVSFWDKRQYVRKILLNS